jgi:hypothetical protein
MIVRAGRVQALGEMSAALCLRAEIVNGGCISVLRGDLSDYEFDSHKRTVSDGISYAGVLDIPAFCIDSALTKPSPATLITSSV